MLLLLRFLTFFYVFFQNPKNVTFYVFFCFASYVFSTITDDWTWTGKVFQTVAAATGNELYIVTITLLINYYKSLTGMDVVYALSIGRNDM